MKPANESLFCTRSKKLAFVSMVWLRTVALPLTLIAQPYSATLIRQGSGSAGNGSAEAGSNDPLPITRIDATRNANGMRDMGRHLLSWKVPPFPKGSVSPGWRHLERYLAIEARAAAIF